MEESPTKYLWNVNNISDPDRFNATVASLMNNLVKRVVSGSYSIMFTTGDVNFTYFYRIYGMVQCTPDISKLYCDRCLSASLGEIPKCCDGKQGGRVLEPSCNIRYETFLFYDPADATQTSFPPETSPPSPSPAPVPATSTNSTDNRSSTSRTVVIIVVPTIILLIIAGLTCAYFLMMKPKEDVKNEDRNKESLRFDLGTIRAATNDFSDDNKLGQGGFGSVYKGRLSDGQEIAVKRLAQCSAQGELEFKNEIVLIASLQHRNLVRLLGFCLEGRERLLIYEFIHKPSLDCFIFGK